MENSSNLKNIKNWNYLYHEIISLEPNSLNSKEQIEILTDIGEKYLQMRAKNNLSYGKIHLEKQNPHLHLCISSNEIYSNKRLRLSKAKFKQIQQDIETYKNEKYPHLKREIYNKNSKSNIKLTQKKQELIKRTHKPSEKELFRTKLENILDSVINYKNLLEELKNANIDIIKRWNTITAKDLTNNKKYRLKTLWLLDKLESVKTRVSSIKQRSKEIKKFRNINDNQNLMNSIQAKKIKIVDLLTNIWLAPNSIKGADYWYISPFRDESTPSFKVNTDDNIRYDHWKWEGGNILDFIMTSIYAQIGQMSHKI